MPPFVIPAEANGAVTPANAGAQQRLDSGFRRNDENSPCLRRGDENNRRLT